MKGIMESDRRQAGGMQGTNRSVGSNNGQPGNPFVFVVGCPRSGTTLLQRMLNSHPHLAVAYDTLFIPAAVRRQKNKNP